MLKRLVTIAEEAGNKIRRDFRNLSQGDVFHKGDVDMVTRVDQEVEEFLRHELKRAFPGVAFVGEEGEYGCLEDYDRCFVVDPLDGTTSFIHGHPFHSVSIGYREAGKYHAGVVHLPAFGESYWAARGAGAFHDGQPIRVSSTSCLLESLAATGFACIRARLPQNNLPLFCEVMPHLRGIRRCGSAAIDLCYVAEGRYDLYWEYNLNAWDIAAGSVILEEAGGRISDLRGDELENPKPHLLASNGLVHEEFLAYSRAFA